MIFGPETCLNWAARLMPKGRAEWLRAMEAELQTIENPKARRDFAFGCLTSAGLALCQSRKGLSYIARGGGSALIMAGSVFGILSVRPAASDPETLLFAQIVTGLCLIYMVAGGLLLASLRALKIYAACGALAAASLWAVLMTTSAAPPHLPLKFLTAVSVEVTGVMTVLTAAAVYLGWLYRPEESVL